MVHAHDEDGCIILGWGRNDGLLGATLSVSTCSLFVVENTSALGDVVSTDAAPRDLRWVGLVEDIDLLAIHFDATIDFLDCALEPTYPCKITSSA